MKLPIILVALSLSCSLMAYEEPNKVCLAKNLYHRGNYKEALQMFESYLGKYDKDSPSIPGIDAYIGKMACQVKLGREKEYTQCLDILSDYLFEESCNPQTGIPDQEFSDMFNSSLFREIFVVKQISRPE